MNCVYVVVFDSDPDQYAVVYETMEQAEARLQQFIEEEKEEGYTKLEETRNGVFNIHNGRSCWIHTADFIPKGETSE